MNTMLIPPHGGSLVNCYTETADSNSAYAKAAQLPQLILSERNLADLECLATGVYSPLVGFVDEEEYYSILNNMRLKSGLAWSIPVTLAIPEDNAEKFKIDEEIALVHPLGSILAIMKVTSKFKPSLEQEAQKVYGTTNKDHPGVRAMYNKGEIYLGGSIEVIKPVPHKDFQSYRLTPAASRSKFEELGWKTIAAFQTRNPIHRAHEYITKVALEITDGLFINPLVGLTKSDDISATVRMICYETLIDKYYSASRVLLGVFPAAMHYAGPREAIMHAIARQNYGCTHLIVGRDHAGVSNYYGTYDAQSIFDEFTSDELKIAPLKFEHAFYCTRSQGMATAKTSPGNAKERIHLSGTKVREMLRNGQRPPSEFTRPEIADILVYSMSEHKQSASVG